MFVLKIKEPLKKITEDEKNRKLILPVLLASIVFVCVLIAVFYFAGTKSGGRDKNAVSERREPNKGISDEGVTVKNNDESSQDKSENNSIEESRKKADMVIIKDENKNSGEKDTKKSENNGVSGESGSLKDGEKDSSGKTESGDKEKENEPPDVLKIINDLRDKTMAKVKGYINEDISPLSVEITAEDNIALREKLMKYDLYVDILKADNEKDRELIEKVNTYDRDEVKDFSY